MVFTALKALPEQTYISADRISNLTNIMKISSLKIVPVFTMVLLTTMIHAQSRTDTVAIRNLIQEEIVAWNKWDAEAYSRHFAAEGTFTNILGMFYTGHKDFQERHEQIFKGVFHGTKLQQNIVSLRFIRPDVAVVETLTWVSGFSNAGPPQGAHTDEKGRLRTRLLQLMVKDEAGWKIEVYHNVDIKPGVTVLEPQ